MEFEVELCLSSTCYLSRKHLIRSKLLENVERVTFHSLYYRIFESAIAEDPTQIQLKNLGGPHMRENVRLAVQRVIKNPSDEEIEEWYLTIRSHMNKGDNISNKINGKEILVEYLKLKNEELDWEDSAHIAKYLLENKKIKQINNFYFKNIIIPDFEVVESPENRNTLEFLAVFLKWNEEYGSFNFYKIFKGEEVIAIQEKEENPIFTELFIFNTNPRELEHYAIVDYETDEDKVGE